MAITLKEAITILRAGGVVAYPTETVYGLAARVDSPSSVARVKKMKGREGNKPLLIALPRVSSIPKYCVVSKKEMAFLGEILPGPVSVLLPRKSNAVGNHITKGRLVGIRVPKSRIAQALSRSVGAITSTSANLSGKPPARTGKDAERLFGIFSAIPGKCPRNSLPSTIIDIKSGKIVRKGAYPEKRLLLLWRKHFS